MGDAKTNIGRQVFFDPAYSYSGFVPAAVLPEQLERGAFKQPEKNLLKAILEDALKILARPQRGEVGKEAVERRDVEEWMEAPWDAREVRGGWQFEDLCELIDLDPAAVRREVRRFQATQAGPGRQARKIKARQSISGRTKIVKLDDRRNHDTGNKGKRQVGKRG